MIPLVVKVFLTWLIEVYVYHSLSSSDQTLAAAAGFEKPRGVGFGVGLAFIIFGMQGSLHLRLFSELFIHEYDIVGTSLVWKSSAGTHFLLIFLMLIDGQSLQSR